MWTVVVFGIIVITMLGFCWVTKMEETQDWNLDEPYDFWMTEDDSQA